MAQIHTLPQPVPALPEDAVLSGEAGTLALYHAASAKVAALLEADLASGDAVYSGADIAQLRASIAPLATLPPRGIGTLQALDHVGRAALEHALRIANPAAMAHLHCPVLVSALAAEMLASATNPSLDSWDQSPFATLAEEALCWELARLSGLPSGASGSFTSGGSQSNLTALLLAREKAMPAGLQGEASRPVILCSELAHFTIAKSARVLGLGPEAVVCVPADPAFRMDIPALEAIMTRLKAEGRKVIALVATAGTTDFGSIDPLPELVQLARREGIWLHVDAAFGGGALLSNHHAHLLEGLGEADSIALDFHKMLFQPVACGVLLLRDPQDFAPLAMHADYLNPEESLFEGAPDLVERSLQTTRRFDALKVMMSFQALGHQGYAELVDAAIANAAAAGELLAQAADFTLAAPVVLNTVVFRYHGAGTLDERKQDALHLAIRKRLYLSGRAALATTRLKGRVHLKFTILNPATGPAKVEALINEIRADARRQEADHA